MHNIALTYLEEIDNVYQVEMVNAEKEGDYYRLISPPFFAKHLAVGDLIEVEDEDGVHHFEDLIEKSGSSTIRIIFWDESIIDKTSNELIYLGANIFTLPHTKKYIALDIRKEINYQPIKDFLKEGMKNNLWEYEEACLGWK